VSDESDNLVVLPGVERRDLGHQVETADVLGAATAANLHDVIVVARKADGDFYIAASDGNADAVVGKLFHAATFIATSRVERL
jgi:hypothetical protein